MPLGPSAAADLDGDFCGGGQARETWIGAGGTAGSRSGGARPARRRWAGWREFFLLTGALEEPGFERGGALQAAGDAGEDQPDIDGAGVAREEAEGCGGRVLAQRGGKLLAVVDELADEAEEEAGAFGPVAGGGWAILGRIGGGWFGRRLVERA